MSEFAMQYPYLFTIIAIIALLVAEASYRNTIKQWWTYRLVKAGRLAAFEAVSKEKEVAQDKDCPCPVCVEGRKNQN